jgi:NADH dehydrogenase FAD-containing subunit
MSISIASAQSQSKARVVVLGAGYSGLLAAIRLAGKSRRAEVTLINPREEFVERVRLHQYAANQNIRQKKLADILGSAKVSFVRGTATAVDLNKKSVLVNDEHLGSRDVKYEYLIYALGSQTDVDEVPGAHEYAYSLNLTGGRSVEQLRERLKDTPAHMRCLVVGGGPTGIESAAEFAESFPQLEVTLATRAEVLPMFPGKPRDYVIERLQRMGVRIRTHTTVAEVTGDAVITRSGDTIPFDILLWAGGFKADDLARQSGLSVNQRGQILVDSYQRAVSHPEVLAVGDASYPAYSTNAEFRMAAFTSMVSGAHAADSLANLLNGRPMRPLSFAYVGLGIALGRKDAVGLNTYPYGLPNSFPMFTGRLAANVREFFVHFLAASESLERVHPGTFSWLGAPKPHTSAQSEKTSVTA